MKVNGPLAGFRIALDGPLNQSGKKLQARQGVANFMSQKGGHLCQGTHATRNLSFPLQPPLFGDVAQNQHEVAMRGRSLWQGRAVDRNRSGLGVIIRARRALRLRVGRPTLSARIPGSREYPSPAPSRGGNLSSAADGLRIDELAIKVAIDDQNTAGQ